MNERESSRKTHISGLSYWVLSVDKDMMRRDQDRSLGSYLLEGAEMIKK